MKYFFITIYLIMFWFASPLVAAPAQEQGVITKQQAIEITQKHYPGRVLNVKHKATFIRVKILSDNGEVRIIKVDNNTGRIIGGK